MKTDKLPGTAEGRLPTMRFISLVLFVSILLFTSWPTIAGAQVMTPISQTRYVRAYNVATNDVKNASDFGPFNTGVFESFSAGTLSAQATAHQNSLIGITNITASGDASGSYCCSLFPSFLAQSQFSYTFSVDTSWNYSASNIVDAAVGTPSVTLTGPSGQIFKSVRPPIGAQTDVFTGSLPPGQYTLQAQALTSGGPNQYGSATFAFSFAVSPSPPPFAITALTVSSNDVLVAWQTAQQTTNVVQVTGGASDGSYSNNFVTISPLIVVPGTNNFTGATTNYLDVGGAAHSPSRFYRIATIGTQLVQYASDNAADPAYTNGWNNGSNGGSGFGAWTLTASSVLNGANDGFFVGPSTNNAFLASPGIDTSGKSWGIYANNNNFTAAYRAFNSSLPVGGTFKMDMDNGFIDTSNTVGFVLRNGNASGSFSNYNTAARFELFFRGGDPSGKYQAVDSLGQRNTGVSYTGTGLHLVFTLNTVDTYTLLTIDNASNTTNTLTGTLSGTAGSAIDSIALYNRNAGTGPLYGSG